MGGEGAVEGAVERVDEEKKWSSWGRGGLWLALQRMNNVSSTEVHFCQEPLKVVKCSWTSAHQRFGNLTFGGEKWPKIKSKEKAPQNKEEREEDITIPSDLFFFLKLMCTYTSLCFTNVYPSVVFLTYFFFA